MACATVEVNKSGTIFHYTKDTGKMTGRMVEADSFTPMETSTKGSGKMTKLTEREYTQKTTVRVTQDNGSKTFSTDMASNAGPTTLHTKGTHFVMQRTSLRFKARQGKVHLA